MSRKANLPRNRFAFLPLTVEYEDGAESGEIMVDPDSGHMFVKGDDGLTHSKTKENEERLNNIKMGGMNLLRNTSNFQNLDFWHFEKMSNSDSDFNISKDITRGNLLEVVKRNNAPCYICNKIYEYNNHRFNLDEEYIINVNLKSNVGTQVEIALVEYDFTNPITVTVDLQADVWKTVNLPLKIDKVIFRPQLRISTTTIGTLQLDKLQLRTGNVEMSWAPNPDDNSYIHPTGDGNLHLPSTGSNSAGKMLVAGDTPGSASWEDVEQTIVNVITNINNKPGEGGGDDGEGGSGNNSDVNTSEIPISNGKLNINLNVEMINGLKEIEIGRLSMEKTNLDERTGIYKKVIYKRPDGTVYMISELLGDFPYADRTEEYYNTKGIMIEEVKYHIEYDSNNNLVKESIVPQGR